MGITGFDSLEADVSLTGNEWKRHPIVTGPEAPCILGRDFLQNGHFKDPKGLSCGPLNEVTPPLSTAVLDMLELQYELESKAVRWSATTDIANAFFSIPLTAEWRPQFAFTWRSVQYTWNQLPQGWKHSPTICHRLIQAALEKSEVLEHLQYMDDIIVWGNTAAKMFEKGEKSIHILLNTGFAIKKSEVKGPAQEIQFLGIKWEDRQHQITTNVIKITVMSPPTNKKETQAFLSAIGFWKMHIPERVFRGSEANYSPTEKEILAAYEGVQAA
ncbi:hypothetical protein HGM15179_018998 [Zosterops borbonicus]|uniref:ribonuclease H n=1 Tax=Zosterops borbonicus TaxID=364589 RepID=A0A8K1DAH4_9PASS|nr:hypothetical protein HGM15179_019792 [Zosterops borbonicus]TRZ08112.1 hypothetical protein HGM15179_018998 [Zosterops borbonicus]